MMMKTKLQTLQNLLYLEQIDALDVLNDEELLKYNSQSRIRRIDHITNIYKTIHEIE